MSQTSVDLRPTIEIKERLVASLSTESDNVVCLLGFATKAGINPLYNINEPISLGVIVDIPTLVTKLNDLGIVYKLISDTVIDKSQSDELACMLFNAVVSYRDWIENREANTLNPPSFVIGILTVEDNDKDGAGGLTPFGDFFNIVLEDKMQIDSICPSYVFVTGDNTVAGGFMGDLVSYTNAIIAEKNPMLGFNYILFHDSLPRETDFASREFPEIVRSSLVNAWQLQVTPTLYQVTSPMVGAMVAMLVASLNDSCEGLYQQPIFSMPAPEGKEGWFKDSQVTEMLQNGISPINYNPQSRRNEFVRIVTSNLTDVATGLPRTNMLDMQSWKAAYGVERALYIKLASDKNILNAKTKVLKDGSFSTVEAVRNVVQGVCITAASNDLIMEPSNWNDVVNIYLDPTDDSKVIFDLNISPLPINTGVKGTVNLIGSNVYYSKFIVNTNGV
tara:strand:+ start:2618 stop:3958 length:1341 start_codon:yes stop_codon:yes gene_type:complete